MKSAKYLYFEVYKIAKPLASIHCKMISTRHRSGITGRKFNVKKVASDPGTRCDSRSKPVCGKKIQSCVTHKVQQITELSEMAGGCSFSVVNLDRNNLGDMSDAECIQRCGAGGKLTFSGENGIEPRIGTDGTIYLDAGYIRRLYRIGLLSIPPVPTSDSPADFMEWKAMIDDFVGGGPYDLSFHDPLIDALNYFVAVLQYKYDNRATLAGGIWEQFFAEVAVAVDEEEEECCEPGEASGLEVDCVKVQTVNECQQSVIALLDEENLEEYIGTILVL